MNGQMQIPNGVPLLGQQARVEIVQMVNQAFPVNVVLPTERGGKLFLSSGMSLLQYGAFASLAAGLDPEAAVRRAEKVLEIIAAKQIPSGDQESKS